MRQGAEEKTWLGEGRKDQERKHPGGPGERGLLGNP